MTTKELTEIVNQHSLTLAEMNQALVHLTRNSLILHESIKSLEVTALAHDAQIDELIESGKKRDEAIANLEKQWQAYISRQPQN